MRTTKNYSVVFDADGTLWNLDKYIPVMHELMANIANRLAGKLVIDPEPSKENIENTYEALRLPFDESNRYLLRLGINPKDFWQDVYKLDHENKKRMLDTGELYLFDDVKPCLQGIREMGFKIGMLTDSPKDMAEIQCNQHGIREYFDGIVSGFYKGHLSKPDSLGLQVLLCILNSSSEKSLIVGDSDKDVLAGKNIDMPTIMIKRNHYTYNDENPDFIIHSLNTLRGVIYELQLRPTIDVRA